MNFNQWTDLEYLRTGSQTQAEVYQLLNKYKLLQLLRDYNPILVGTVPIGINVEGSDLDIICEVKNFNDFEILVRAYFEDYFGFSVTRRQVDGMERIKANFYLEDWPIEIFGQSKPTIEQNGFRHMVIEDRMLKMYGKRFKDRILNFKSEGIKTEPAFANALHLAGNPYQRPLEIYHWTDEEIRNLWVDSDDVV